MPRRRFQQGRGRRPRRRRRRRRIRGGGGGLFSPAAVVTPAATTLLLANEIGDENSNDSSLQIEALDDAYADYADEAEEQSFEFGDEYESDGNEFLEEGSAYGSDADAEYSYEDYSYEEESDAPQTIAAGVVPAAPVLTLGSQLTAGTAMLKTGDAFAESGEYLLRKAAELRAQRDSQNNVIAENPSSLLKYMPAGCSTCGKDDSLTPDSVTYHVKKAKKDDSCEIVRHHKGCEQAQKNECAEESWDECEESDESMYEEEEEEEMCNDQQDKILEELHEAKKYLCDLEKQLDIANARARLEEVKRRCAEKKLDMAERELCAPEPEPEQRCVAQEEWCYDEESEESEYCGPSREELMERLCVAREKIAKMKKACKNKKKNIKKKCYKDVPVAHGEDCSPHMVEEFNSWIENGEKTNDAPDRDYLKQCDEKEEKKTPCGIEHDDCEALRKKLKKCMKAGRNFKQTVLVHIGKNAVRMTIGASMLKQKNSKNSSYVFNVTLLPEVVSGSFGKKFVASNTARLMKVDHTGALITRSHGVKKLRIANAPSAVIQRARSVIEFLVR